MTVEIYFDDICPEKQQQLLDEANVSTKMDMNWDVLPIFEFELEMEDEI